MAAIAAISIVALAAAAATLDTARPTGGGLGPGSDGGTGAGDTEGGNPLGFDDRGGGPIFAGRLPAWGGCIDFLRSPEFFAGVAAFVGLFVLVVRHRHDTLVAGALLLAWGLPAFVVYLFLAACPSASADGDVGLVPSELENASRSRGGGMPGASEGTSPVPPSLALLALLGLVLLVAVAVVLRASDDEAVVPERPPQPSDEERVAEIGRVAGEAADRIAGAGDLENEVYRAWREMVALLDVDNPRATTPGEFARAATAAGMARADVAELTDLFEAVRYGGAAPTAEREAAAVAALRRIESAYAGDDAPGWPDAGDGGSDADGEPPDGGDR